MKAVAQCATFDTPGGSKNRPDSRTFAPTGPSSHPQTERRADCCCSSEGSQPVRAARVVVVRSWLGRACSGWSAGLAVLERLDVLEHGRLQLYPLAYGRVDSNKGAMTPGPDAETAEGMTPGKIERIIDALRHERYHFKPVKRHYIPKNGKQRPLGLPSWSDKLLGEVIRLLLEAYYEPQLSDRSHGYRPARGCHTTLREVAVTWTRVSWSIESDISQCFDPLDRQVMLETLGEKIHDNRFLRLVGQTLAAGYLEGWVWNATLSGVLQGGVLPRRRTGHASAIAAYSASPGLPPTGEHDHPSSRIAHRGPGVPVRRPSPVSSSQPSNSASAT
jgi:hypothetical protein